MTAPTESTTQRPLGANQQMIRIVYPQIDWDQYDKEVREQAEADLQEALRLLASVRDADVIFAKSDWHISQAIAAFLDKHRKEQVIEGYANPDGSGEGNWSEEA